MIYIVEPAGGYHRSGGYRYNERLCEHSDAFVRVRVPGDLEVSRKPESAAASTAASTDAVLVDSLFLSQRLPVLPPQLMDLPRILMAHSLPSLLPAEAAAPEAAAREAAECESLKGYVGAVAPSAYMARALHKRGMPEHAIAVQPPAPVIDGRITAARMSSWWPQERDPDVRDQDARLRVLNVANYLPAKGQLELIELIAGLPESSISCVLAGSAVPDPRHADMLSNRIDGLGIGDIVHMVREPDDRSLAQLYAAADLYVSLSHMESYGITIAEAMSFGLPVLGTTGHAVAEVFGPAVRCVRPDAARHAMSHLIDSAAERARLASASRKMADSLPDWPVVAGGLAHAVGILAQRPQRSTT